MKIKSIYAREIVDSRGNPTIEVAVEAGKGLVGRAAVPSGASTGTHEALELRDGDKKRYGGKGVLKACENVNMEIARVLKGKDVTNQEFLDKIMIDLDGTANKSKLGANAILGVSLACARAASLAQKEPLYRYINSKFQIPDSRLVLPTPMFNILNGGKHADSGLDIQEFMVIPLGAGSFKEKLRAGSEIFQSLKTILKSNNYSVAVGDEGGYAPKLEANTDALELIMKAIEKTEYKAGKDVFIGIDAAASEFYNVSEDRYVLKAPAASLLQDQMIALYNEWIQKYPLISIEDGLHEDGWGGWSKLKAEINNSAIFLVGDDFLVTNVKRLDKAIEMNAANAVIVKPNQIGTLTETIEFIKKAQGVDWKIIVSHRSGETEDSFISDLAVAVGADFIKSGAPSRGERVVKYNRLMEIEEELIS